MPRLSQRLGAEGDQQAVGALYRVGVEQVEKIGTPVKIVAVSPDLTHRGIYQVIFGEKVIGDYRGVAPGGISVIAEVKSAFGRNLHWSDLLPHQPPGLDRHDELGGISLLVWVTDNGVHVLRWPVKGFGPGKGLTPEAADKMSIRSL